GGAAAIERLSSMKSLTITGTVSINGQPGTFREQFCPPDRLLLTVDLGSYRVSQGYDGKTAWQTDMNGHASEITGFEKNELVKSAYFESAADVLPRADDVEKLYEGVVSRDGQDYHQVAFVFFTSDTVRILFDLKTALPAVRLANLDNTQTVSQVSQFKSVSHVLFPFKAVSTAIGAPLTVVFTADSIHFDLPVDQSIFAQPVSIDPAVYFPAESTRVTLPIDYRNGHLYITATVNGKRKGKFILDSGCSASIFHAPFIASLDLPKSGAMPAKGVGGFESIELLQTDSISIGPVTLFKQIVGATDLSNIGSGDSLPFAGILGYDFLSRFPLLIDYHEETLTLFDPAHFTPPTGGHEIPFSLTMQVPTVQATIFDALGDFIVDLGNANGLLLHDAFVKAGDLRKKLGVDSQSTDRSLVGVGGGFSGVRTTIDRIELEGFSIDSVSAILSSSSGGMTGSAAIAGNIGNGVLERYRLLFDYAHHRLIFY
ncbi:MAG: retropepsin-like aspartic protease, partial [Candidatus Zixiibacteriota bacterium]